MTTTRPARTASQEVTLARIEETFNEIIRAGRTPGVNDLWLAVQTAPGLSRAGDEDERIGVSARIYPSFGIDIVRDGVRRNVVQYRSAADDRFAFSQNNAVWRMPFRFSHQSL